FFKFHFLNFAPFINMDLKKLTVPGESLSDLSLLPSHNTYILEINDNKKICSSVLGYPQLINKLLLVNPMPNKIFYQSGDLIIGRVKKVINGKIRVAMGLCEGLLNVQSSDFKSYSYNPMNQSYNTLGQSYTTSIDQSTLSKQSYNTSIDQPTLSEQPTFSNQPTLSQQSSTTPIDQSTLSKQSYNTLSNQPTLSEQSYTTSMNQPTLSKQYNEKYSSTNLSQQSNNHIIHNLIQKDDLILAQIQKTNNRIKSLSANAKFYGLLTDGFIFDIPTDYINYGKLINKKIGLMLIKKRLFSKDDILYCVISKNNKIFINQRYVKILTNYFYDCFRSKTMIDHEQIEKIIDCL
ncbi:exosome complex exonuclease rrp4, partial [Pseudoloma neurophilia]